LTEAAASPGSDRIDRPIVVCGPARSGTTAVAIMLSEHAEISIGREVPLERLPSLAPLLGETAAYHRPHEWTARRRAEVVRALWFAVGRPPRQAPARRWGMKTPWSEFDRSLWDGLVEPQYVYVLRRGDRVFRSHVKLGWGSARSPERLIARYKESVKVGEEMQRSGAAHIVQLDLAEDRDSRWKLAEGLFSYLGEEIDAGVSRFVTDWPTPWQSHATSEGGKVELPAEWRRLLDADAEYQALMAAHGYR